MTTAATAQEHKPSGELWILAIAVGGSLGSGNGALGDIVELMVDSGAAVKSCPPWSGTDPLISQEPSTRNQCMPTDMHSDRYYGGREQDFSVAVRQVRVKFVVTDVMCTVPSVEKKTQHGF